VLNETYHRTQDVRFGNERWFTPVHYENKLDKKFILHGRVCTWAAALICMLVGGGGSAQCLRIG